MFNFILYSRCRRCCSPRKNKNPARARRCWSSCTFQSSMSLSSSARIFELPLSILVKFPPTDVFPQPDTKDMGMDKDGPINKSGRRKNMRLPALPLATGSEMSWAARLLSHSSRIPQISSIPFARCRTLDASSGLKGTKASSVLVKLLGICSRTLGPATTPNSTRAPSAGVPCLGEMHDDTMPRQALHTLIVVLACAPHRARLYPPLLCLELATLGHCLTVTMYYY